MSVIPTVSAHLLAFVIAAINSAPIVWKIVRITRQSGQIIGHYVPKNAAKMINISPKHHKE